MEVVSPQRPSQLGRPRVETPDPPQPVPRHECLLEATYPSMYETTQGGWVFHIFSPETQQSYKGIKMGSMVKSMDREVIFPVLQLGCDGTSSMGLTEVLNLSLGLLVGKMGIRAYHLYFRLCQPLG